VTSAASQVQPSLRRALRKSNAMNGCQKVYPNERGDPAGIQIRFFGLCLISRKTNQGQSFQGVWRVSHWTLAARHDAILTRFLSATVRTWQRFFAPPKKVQASTCGASWCHADGMGGIVGLLHEKTGSLARAGPNQYERVTAVMKGTALTVLICLT
jgi:hypothetical protein